MGHPTMKLGKFLLSFRPRAWEKVKRCYQALKNHKYDFIKFITDLEMSGELRKESGFLGNFLLRKSFAMEVPKSPYGLK